VILSSGPKSGKSKRSDAMLDPAGKAIERSSAPGINAIGYFRGNHGLGVLARQTARLILNRQVPLALFTLDANLNREERDPTLEPLMVDSLDALPYDVNLFIGAIGDLPWMLMQYREFITKSAGINVALSMWELAVTPVIWQRALEVFDVLVTPSDFMRHTFAAVVPGTFVLSMEHPVEISADGSSCRERFGLPSDKVLFMSSFDPWSDTVRKNPQGAIAAFQKAMDGDDSAHLVIKLNNARRGTDDHPDVDVLKNICREDSRIHLLTESLSYAEAMNLYASCDVLVSLHRAEGLGLALMEFMALGKPVVATAWSGNMTFMNHMNSCLVGYDLIPVDGGIDAYRKTFLNSTAVWAEPRIDEAAEWLKRLAGDSTLRAEIGRRAASDICRHNAEAGKARFLDEILAISRRPRCLEERVRKRTALINAVKDSIFDQHHNRLACLGRDLRRMLDRHVVWRFHSAS
jgi:glycosyltransferase involved in cell wall biosynthesis